MVASGRRVAHRIRVLRDRVGRTMEERDLPSTEALGRLSDEELADLDSVLQIAHFILYRRDATGRAQKVLAEVVKIAEEAAAEAEGSEYRSEEFLARAEAAVGRIRECHRRAISHPGAGRA